MKIWFDILTPKELLFFEPMVKKMKKKHTVLCTTRNYKEVITLGKVRRFPLKSVGKYGGAQKFGKLMASTNRIAKLAKIINDFTPELVISFCSPEAARISHGLGITHVGFSDSPHHDAVMKICGPQIQKLLTPWIIPKKEFTKHGFNHKDIVTYKAIDAASISRRKISNKIKLPYDTSKKTILIRPAEDQAAYMKKQDSAIQIIEDILKKYKNENIIVLARYPEQKKSLKNRFGNKIQILDMAFDGKLLLNNCNVFIGSGGTMTTESALLGVPTISYIAFSSKIIDYLVRKKLMYEEANPQKITVLVSKIFSLKNNNKNRAKNVISSMEDPYLKLVKIVKQIGLPL